MCLRVFVHVPALTEMCLRNVSSSAGGKVRAPVRTQCKWSSTFLEYWFSSVPAAAMNQCKIPSTFSSGLMSRTSKHLYRKTAYLRFSRLIVACPVQKDSYNRHETRKDFRKLMHFQSDMLNCKFKLGHQCHQLGWQVDSRSCFREPGLRLHLDQRHLAKGPSPQQEGGRCHIFKRYWTRGRRGLQRLWDWHWANSAFQLVSGRKLVWGLSGKLKQHQEIHSNMNEVQSTAIKWEPPKVPRSLSQGFFWDSRVCPLCLW